jgi:hypothetical protein
MKSFLTVILLVTGFTLSAQNCDCASQLSYTIRYFEENSPAFQKIKNNDKDFTTYAKGILKIRTEAFKEKNTDRCIFYLDRYVRLLKDHHSGIGFNLKKKDLGSAEKIEAFKKSDEYQKFEKIEIDTSTLIPYLESKPSNDIEGIYSDGGNLVFGMVHRKGSKNQYQGVLLRKNRLMDQGHVLLELTMKKDNFFDVIYNIGLLGFNFQRIYKNIVIENGQIPSFGFSKASGTMENSNYYEFKSLDNSTNYLRLSSFDSKHIIELDSLYTTIATQLATKPKLILDLRNNGGGSERSYLNLLPYAYTDPLKIDSAQIWVSPENIKRYEESGTDQYKEVIERMNLAKPFTFIPFTKDAVYTWSLDSITTLPAKIAVLYNRGTASAAEGFILYLMQSKKVITIGENSGGYIGYGNVMTAQTPCGQYTIQCTTTKYAEKSKYEFTGIPPQYRPGKLQDWVVYAINLMNTQ